ncbi:MAG: hypothetical protein M1816_001431 [Peltula sp. TS41687]|nr:MAG: hypothetical protein M1816_001431 [Peltula sp. TS41687]
MFRWLQGPGAVFRDPLPGSTNYLGAYNKDGHLIRSRQKSAEDSDEGSTGQYQASSRDEPLPEETELDLLPFPMNPDFRSQPVLDESLKQEIYNRVVQDGRSVKVVSAELGVEMNRVGAVVRLKEVESRWVREGKPLARPYARAVLSMLPQTTYVRSRPVPHESINDLPTHPATLQQIFHPTSESRVFTRADAAEIFYPGLLPADKRIPHPELIELERERQEGLPREVRVDLQRERTMKEEEERAEVERKRKAREARTLKTILSAEQGGKGGRWEWHVRDISVESVGKDGRAWTGVGWRYGVPHQDRKRGQIKIPTKVE